MVNAPPTPADGTRIVAPAATLTLSVVVPVHNEARTLETILRRVRAVPLPIEIIAVDDGSGDASPEILARLAAEGVVNRVIRHAVNRGKGAAIRTGIDAATGDVIVPQDADLEYDPADLVRLIEPIRQGEADAVYGSRFLEGNNRGLYPSHYFGNRLLTMWSNLFTGLRLGDMETCYKMIRAPLLKALPLTTDRFGIEPEITARLAQAKARILELPIAYAGRSFAAGKKITWRDGVAGLFHIIRFSRARPR